MRLGGWDMSIGNITVFMVAVAVLSQDAVAQCEPELIGSRAGQVLDIVRVGDLVYAANYHGGLVIYDISDLHNPFVVGELPDCGDPVSVAVSGDYAYLTTSQEGLSFDDPAGLVVADVSNPSTPTLVSFLTLPRRPADLAIVGDYAYIVGDGLPFTVVDISTPDQPIVVGTNADEFWDAGSITMYGQHAFVTDRSSGLVIFDVSDPTASTIISETWVGSSPLDIEISSDGTTVFVGRIEGPVVIIDVNDPLNPTTISTSLPVVQGSLNGIALDGDRLYGFGLRRFGALDISNLAMPTRIGFFLPLPNAFGVEGLFVDDIGVVAGSFGGLRTVDYSDLANPIELGRVEVLDTANDVLIQGDATFVFSQQIGISRWIIVDSSDPTNPQLAGTMNTGRLAIEDDIATLGNTLLDMSDPLSPQPIGQVTGLTPPNDAVIQDGFGYYVVQESVFIADLRVPATAAVIGQLNIARSTTSIAVQEDLLAVGANIVGNPVIGGLTLVNAAEPQSLEVLGTLEFDLPVVDVLFASDILLVVLTRNNSQLATISLVSVLDPTNPAVLGSMSFPRSINRLSLVNGLIAIPAEGFGMDLLDISSPAAPAIVAHVPLPGRFQAVTLKDGLAHIGAGIHGYLIMDLLDCLPQSGCVGDISSSSSMPDGQVGFDDFLALLGLIGPCPGGAPGCTGDIADEFGTTGADGEIGFGDFLALLGLIGPCP